MATYKRLPRERRRTVDEFRHWTYHLVDWMMKHRRSMAIVVGVSIGALTLATGGLQYWNHRKANASQQLFEAGKFPAESDEQVKALERLREEIRKQAPP